MAVVATSRPALPRSVWTLAALAAFLLVPLLARSQSMPSSSNSAQKPTNPPAKKPSTAEQFPYPGDSTPPDSSSPSETKPQDNSTPDAPSSGSAPSTPGNAARQFPYPGDSPTPARTTTNPAPQQFPYPGDSPGPGATGNSSSSGDDSSSSSSSGSDFDPDADPDSKLPPPTKGQDVGRRKLEKVRDLQTPDEREAEDLKVGKFYQDKGDWNAAYMRYKDAVKYQPDDPDAHFFLAETALKLNKRDEAISEYKATLALDASDKQMKLAKKALAGLK
jgi:Tetratricopeptide repeat